MVFPQSRLVKVTAFLSRKDHYGANKVNMSRQQLEYRTSKKKA
jgi:hypothetical protein